MVLLAVFALLVPSSAWAGWTRCPGSTTDTGTGDATPSQGNSVCVRQTTATDPARVNATACRGGVSITFQDVTATNYDASVLVYQCSDTGSAGVFTDCKLVPIDRDGDGAGDGLPLTGDEAALQFGLWDLAPDWYAFDITNGSSRTIELKAICR